MQKLKAALLLFVFSFFLLSGLPGYSQELSFSEQVVNTLEEITDYKTLIDQINTEKQDKIGYEARALKKQLDLTEESYRNLLWQLAADLSIPENAATLKQHRTLITSLLIEESATLNKEIEQTDQAVIKLEDRIINAKKKIFTTNQAISKDRLADIQWRLYLERINQEKLYSALVNNSITAQSFGENVSQDLNLARKLVESLKVRIA